MPPSVALPATSAATAAAAAALTAGLRFVDAEVPAAEVGTVGLCDGVVSVAIVHFHEPEAARATRVAIGDHRRVVHGPELGEKLTELSVAGAPRQITYVDSLHEKQTPNLGVYENRDDP
jgi:hypothetical protein